MLDVLAPVFNFFMVLAIFYFAGRKAFMGMLASRSETVRKEMTEAETLYGEASKALSENENNFRNREALAKREMDEAFAAAQRNHDRTLTSARNEAERIKREAKMMGSNEVERAKQNLQKELAEKSLEMASIYLDKHLDAKDKGKLVQEYVELVGNGPS